MSKTPAGNVKATSPSIESSTYNLLRRDSEPQERISSTEHRTPWFDSVSRRGSENVDHLNEWPTRHGSSDVD